ncbi:myb-related transcription factor, partner of profilin-like isoform X2 [Schistocerca gregaria]|uniref:myb-related transcription factor, partner of profilin-like isoform X2 n=1 Tax=Schistocerca gregaria TaxID=7010 RepID=UPI00211DB8F3|nr:myb-related transcription factor, partner of profilin-like isoform X2 [Schistocerca gregaria]
MRLRRSVRVDSAAKDAVASPASSDSPGSGLASSPPATRRRLSGRRFARGDSPETMEWERNNTVRLIELIRARPCLWDASSRRYTERHCRRDALADVARTLGVSLLCVQKKWTNLRTQYFRERTRLQTIPGHSPRWFGFNMMRFLEDGPIGQHQRSSSAGSSGMVVEVVDEDSRADSCWATSTAECGNSSRDPDDVEIVIEQAPCVKQQVKNPFDEDESECEDDESCGSQPPTPTPTPQVALTMPPATPPPAPRQATPTPPPQKKPRHVPKPPPPQPLLPTPSTSGTCPRQTPQAPAEQQPRVSQSQQQPPPAPPPPRQADPPRPLPGRTVQPPMAAEDSQRDYSPPPAAAVRGTKRRVEVVDPVAIPSTSVATPSFPRIAEPREEVHAILHDRLDMYALHVASRIRQIQDPYLRTVAINRIDNALFDAATAELMGQRPPANTAATHSTAPPAAAATAANAHFPPGNPRPGCHGVHMMGTCHQVPAMQPDHQGTTWQNGPVVEDVDSKDNIFMRLS